MTDIQAAIGLIELERYQENMDRRAEIFRQYYEGFKSAEWATCPISVDDSRHTSYHLFQLCIDNITEVQRDAIMHEIFEQDVSVNVHFQPLPLFTVYKQLGYSIENYPVAYAKYASEISLPVYFQLNDDEVQIIIHAVKVAYSKVMG